MGRRAKVEAGKVCSFWLGTPELEYLKSFCRENKCVSLGAGLRQILHKSREKSRDKSREKGRVLENGDKVR
jgi:hypothetical protein